jgi:hypothetical protein
MEQLKTEASWAQNRCNAVAPGGDSTQKTTGNFPTLSLGRERGHSTFSGEEKVESPLSARRINCPFRKVGVNMPVTGSVVRAGFTEPSES